MSLHIGSCTRQEIWDQEAAWRQALSAPSAVAGQVRDLIWNLQPQEFLFIGCGSSYYLSTAAAFVWQKLLRMPARAVPASEIIAHADSLLLPDHSYIAVLVSRSGETTETVEAGKCLASHPRVGLVAVTCSESGFAGLPGVHLHLPSANDQSVVMTRSFTAMLLALDALAATLAGDRAGLLALGALPAAFVPTMERNAGLVRQLAADRSIRRFIFLGSGAAYGVACEAMLKLTEMALVDAQAYHTLEFRHGPWSMVDRESAVWLLASGTAGAAGAGVLAGVRSLGGRTVATGAELPEADVSLPLPCDLPEWAMPLLSMPLIHLLGLYRSLESGLDPDRPRNLTRVVTL